MYLHLTWSMLPHNLIFVTHKSRKIRPLFCKIIRYFHSFLFFERRIINASANAAFPAHSKWPFSLTKAQWILNFVFFIVKYHNQRLQRLYFCLQQCSFFRPLNWKLFQNILPCIVAIAAASVIDANKSFLRFIFLVGNHI